jgi:hydrogenase-1 operon protein HyaE
MTATARPEPVLVTRLVEQQGATRLDDEHFTEYVSQAGETVLFFTEDPQRFKEVLDLAVIVPEIRRAAVKPFRIGVLPPPLANAMASTYGVRRWPALVFLRDGAWLGNIEGLHEWTDFVALADELLKGEARPLPKKVIPLAAAAAPCG